MNIGVHMLDALLWIWGDVRDVSVYTRTATRVAGMLSLERANVRFVLSIDPDEVAERLLVVNGDNVEFTDGFTELHTEVYRQTLAGFGHGIADTRPAIELAARIRSAPLIV
jgi:UDP-N-acetyl-2-amino-2-deoxyglucuronate dehydrogenase